MEPKEIVEFFNKRPRNCLLCTADSKGEVDVAVYGTPRMIDEKTVVLGSGNKRSLQNLRENPRAAILVTEPGEIVHDSKGVRVYLKVTAIETEGALYDEIKEEVEKRAGKSSADNLKAAVVFTVTEVRPLIVPLRDAART